MSAACNATKKNARTIISTTSTPTPIPASPEIVSDNPFRFEHPDGIHAPGTEELKAIQMQYNDITLEKLKEGHVLYTQGACIHCHTPQNIYDHDQAQWKSIIDDMALKAGISDVQKDAVYKYVLAIKATQPK